MDKNIALILIILSSSIFARSQNVNDTVLIGRYLEQANRYITTNPDSAILYLNLAGKFSDINLPDVYRIKYIVLKSIVESNSGNSSESKMLLKKAMAIAKSNKLTNELVTCYITDSELSIKSLNFIEALKTNLEALAYMDTLLNVDKFNNTYLLNKARLLETGGEIYFKLNDFVRAKYFFDAAESIYKQLVVNKKLVYLYLKRADLLISQKQYNQAITVLQKAYNYSVKDNAVLLAAISDFTTGCIYDSLQNYNKSKLYLNKAYDVFIANNDTIQQINALYSLANLEFKVGNFLMSQKYLLQATELFSASVLLNSKLKIYKLLIQLWNFNRNV